MENHETIGAKIVSLRKTKGITQADLGAVLNVSYQAVSKWERDESCPDFVTLSRMAQFFNVPISYFEENGNETAKDRRIDLHFLIGQTALVGNLVSRCQSRVRFNLGIVKDGFMKAEFDGIAHFADRAENLFDFTLLCRGEILGVGTRIG